MGRQGSKFVIGAFAALVLNACASDAPVGIDGGMASQAAPIASVGAPFLGSCDTLATPAGAELAFHTFASGDQIYRWNGTAWAFVAPEASLFADEAENGKVGTHFAGPTWKSNSGSAVVGAVLKRCPSPDNSIPWLLLGAVSTTGPGVFEGITHIQRVNTVGGTAPVAPGTVVGEERRVAYAAEYFFYR